MARALKYFVLTFAETPGGCMIEDFPKDLEAIHRPARGLRLDEVHKGAVALNMSRKIGGKHVPDVVENMLFWLIVSERVRTVIEAHSQDKIEWISVRLLDHKSRAVKDKLFVANPLGAVDCLDRERSAFEMDEYEPDQILTLNRIVLDQKRVDTKRALFRIAGRACVVLVNEQLADALRAANLEGLSLLELGTEVDL